MTRAEWTAAALLLLASAYAAFDATGIGTADAGTATAPTPRLRPPAAREMNSDAIVTRALFAPSRRAAFGSAGGGDGTIGGFVLRGTLSGVAGRFAMFEPARGGTVRRLRVGGTIAGYVLAAIDADSVVLARGSERRRVDIGDPSMTPTPSDSPGVSAPAGPSAPAPGVPSGAETLPIITETDPQEQPL